MPRISSDWRCHQLCPPKPSCQYTPGGACLKPATRSRVNDHTAEAPLGPPSGLGWLQTTGSSWGRRKIKKDQVGSLVGSTNKYRNVKDNVYKSF
eukprot:832027-Rhodomonas_salina.1